MARKTVGYVELEWTCPNCGGKNSGLDKLCTSCGAAQPEDVQFQQAAQETLIQEQEVIEKAKAGPDVHCKFCGTRNPAGAQTCRQCGADLSEAAARESGRVMGAHRAEEAAPVACPACGTLNPATAHHCQSCGASMADPVAKPTPKRPAPAAPTRKRTAPLLFIALAVVACVLLFVFLILPALRTEETTGRVEGVHWTRTIVIEALQPVTHEGWYDDVPSEAILGDCRQEYHHSESEYVPNSEEVCGTPYTLDTGSGVGEVVQDCEYRVFADWCRYTLDEWTAIETLVLEGDDYNPAWPQTMLAAEEREGARGEEYEVTFVADDKVYDYAPGEATTFMQFDIDSEWLLEVDGFGNVRSVAPAD